MGETTLEKNKDYIEFSMHSMMITHKPYQDDADIGITGTIPERVFLAASNPFDIPCDVVMVSKRAFERLQAANEQLKKKLEELDPMPEFKDNHICGGQRSVNGWRGVSSFWRLNYKKLSELVGFSSVEEIQDYLTNEAKCETLHEAIVKLIDANKRVCEEWCSANSENNSWKATAECNSPKELMTKLNLLRDTIEHEHDRTTDIGNLCADYRDQIKAWKDATGCSTPEEVNKKLSSYEGRLDSVKQSASTAIRLLDNIVFRDDKRSDWSDEK